MQAEQAAKMQVQKTNETEKNENGMQH